MKTSDHTRALWTISAVVSLIRCSFFPENIPWPRHVDEKLSIHAIVKSRFSISWNLLRPLMVFSETGHSNPDVCGRSLIARLIYRKRRALNEIMNRIARETQTKTGLLL
jgi:hypothetical protein